MDTTLYDGLTGAYTRALLDVRLQKEISRAARRHTSLSLILVDLDYFKSINDAFGHSRGDQALMELVKCIKANMRDTDDVFRYGGDEFVLMLPDTDISQAVILASRIMGAIQAQPIPGSPPISLSCSIGIASFPEDASTPQNLFEVADRRHYHAKAYGRGRMIWQDDGWLKKDELKPPDRIIARDQSMDAFREFMDSFSKKSLGEFHVHGPKGVGKTRFLHELRNIARLRGYAVLFIEGAPELQSRYGGALQECLKHWQGVEIPFDLQQLPQLLQDVINRKQLIGLVVFMDSWSTLDEATLELVGRLPEGNTFERLAFVYADEGRGRKPFAELEADVHGQTALLPLSEMDVKIWLRYTLSLEPPDELVKLLYAKTGGFPARLEAAVQWLHKQKLLKRGSQAWEFEVPAMASALEQFTGLPASFPPGNLNMPLPVLIGRDSEIKTLRSLVAENRLVTVVGQAGLGKSHLAEQVAAECHRLFPDGIFRVEMAIGRSLDGLVALLKQEIQQPSWVNSAPINTFFASIADKKILLLLDAELESDLDVRFIQSVLARTNSIHVLLTSQSRTNLPSEVAFEIAPLAYPAGDVPYQPALTASEQVFLYYARKAQPGFENDRAQTARICRAVGGLPLALVLAASWVKTLPCEQIAGELEESLALLGNEQPGQLTHGSNLAAVFDSFLGQLSAQEREVFASLSVFEDTFSSRAAQDVAGASAFFLDALVARSMLIPQDGRRYSLHISLRQFLSSQLKNSDLARQVADKHGAYYLGKFLASHKNPDPTVGFTDRDLDNLRKAWQWAVQGSQMKDVENAMLPLATYLRNKGLFREVLNSFNFIYKLLEDVPHSYRDNLLIARALCVMGECHDLLGEYTEGQEVLEKALALARQMESLRDEAEITRSLSSIHSARGEYDVAETLSRQGLALAQQAGENNLLFLFQNNLAVLAYMRGSYKEAIPYCEAALKIAREINDPTRIAQSLNNLGHMYFSLGDLPKARPYLEDSLKLLDQVSSQTMRGSILDTMGKILTATREFDEARQVFARALGIMASMQSVPLIVEVLVGVAELWAAMGREDLALSGVNALINQPVSHDIGLRAARLRAALTKKRVKPSLHAWKANQLQRMVSDVMGLLEGN